MWNNRASARRRAGEVDGSVKDRMQALYAQRFTAAAAQGGLRRTGFYKGPSDGIWAQASEDALRAWTLAGCPDAPKTNLL